MKIIIDRIENDFVVVELPNGKTLDIPCSLLPDATEGDVYSIDKDSSETDDRTKRIKGKMNNLFVE